MFFTLSSFSFYTLIIHVSYSFDDISTFECHIKHIDNFQLVKNLILWYSCNIYLRSGGQKEILFSIIRRVNCFSVHLVEKIIKFPFFSKIIWKNYVQNDCTNLWKSFDMCKKCSNTFITVLYKQCTVYRNSDQSEQFIILSRKLPKCNWVS